MDTPLVPDLETLVRLGVAAWLGRLSLAAALLTLATPRVPGWIESRMWPAQAGDFKEPGRQPASRGLAA